MTHSSAGTVLDGRIVGNRPVSTVVESATPFQGFTELDANFLYCPNQFLDVCLPHSSRGVVRLVAYLLDQTLGWLDPQGDPISQNISVSYRQLIDSAGISRGAIRVAIDEAIEAGFIRCVRGGKAAAAGESAEHAAFALRWDERREYQNRPETFQGFFTGEGYRTPIPNAFFRHVIPHETLIVTKVVGTVLRHTIGYQNQFGGRRSQAPLSYRFIQAYASIPDPKSVSQAISSAIASNYIVCVDEGRFHADPDKRKPAAYAIHWLRDHQTSESGSKFPAGERFNSPSKLAVQNSQQEPFKIPSKTGSGFPAFHQSKISSKERTLSKDTSKQQQKVHVAAATIKGIQLLMTAGFDEATAHRLASRTTAKEIEQQIAWLPRRNPNHNRMGMLRRAIEENWSEPHRLPDRKSVIRERRERDRAQAAADKQTHEQFAADQQRRRQRLIHVKTVWDGMSPEEQLQIENAAFQHQRGNVLKDLFHTRTSHRLRECLAELDRQLFHEPAARGPKSNTESNVF